MSNVFPKLSSGSMTVQGSDDQNPIATYPVTLNSSWVTRTIRFLGDQEQSWSVRPRMFGCELSFESINGYDVARVLDFFHSMHGMYLDTFLLNVFSIKILGTTYDNMVFNQDSVQVHEVGNKPNHYSFTLSMRQVKAA